MNRRFFINKSFAAGLASFIRADSLKKFSSADLNSYNLIIEEPMDNYDIIPAPDDPLKWEEWRESLSVWRKKKQLALKYDGTSYLTEPLRWVSSDFSCCFVMICDSDFYDYKKNEYTISNLIARGKKEYGGYDSVVLWHAYPRIGLDDRNQFDFYREMPGGLTGVKNAVRQFHESGTKVFIDYNPWDKGTRRESKPDIDALIEIIESIDADGIFLDTMKDAPGFREKLDKVKQGIVMEGEISLPLEHIQSHHMSWAQWFRDSAVPGVYRNKWFEHRHMQHAIDRWNSDKIAQLQTAWMNGSGILIWENVFGQWLGWSEKDKAAYRTMYRIQHRFSELFSGEQWTPLSEESRISGVYISSWAGEGMTLRALANRNDSAAEGILLKIKYNNNLRYFDLVTGEEILTTEKNGSLYFKGKIGKKGIACLLSITKTRIDENLLEFLSEQKRAEQSFSDDLAIPVRKIIELPTGEIIKHASVPIGMAAVPSASLAMNIEYTFRESGSFGNIQVHLLLAQKHKLHSVCRVTRNASIRKFAIDETPVTNLAFREFMDKSGYKPRIPESFLRHWVKGEIPVGKEDHPVVYVDIDDARAYAEWKGKKLPSQDEWQFAAQGINTLDYPWGNEMESNRCNLNTAGETTAVRAFPSGASPFGCYDMCGNTWELTGNIYSDGRTRFVMLKGGSCYKAEGSEWYMDGGAQKNSFVAKMLLIWPGLDRCSTVGFRCAVDI